VNIFDFFKGLIWILLNPKRTFRGYQQMSELKDKLETINDISYLLKRFCFRKRTDNYSLVYSPIIEFSRGLVGSDLNSSVVARWAFKQFGEGGNICLLDSGVSRHFVFITNDKQMMVSKDAIIRIDPKNWKDQVLRSSWHANMHFKTVEILL